MNNMEILADAFAYIEQNLQADIKTEDVAAVCCCSKSTLEKIFKCVNNIGVHDYLIRRRMMLAARMMIAHPDMGLLDIALSCGYSTNESFSRAFRSVWNCNPSEFRSNHRFSELFPRLYPPIQDGGTYLSMRKNVDISEMYDLFQERRNCYFVCCDIKQLVPINEISRKAGDLAILETMNRMEREAGEEDFVFRIGGDEFVLLINSEDVKYAEEVSERIRGYNGRKFVHEDREIPLNLHLAIVKFDRKSLRYQELFEQLHLAILENKA